MMNTDDEKLLRDIVQLLEQQDADPTIVLRLSTYINMAVQRYEEDCSFMMTLSKTGD